MANASSTFTPTVVRKRTADVPDRGIDAPNHRPGVPMETARRRVGNSGPRLLVQQKSDARVLKRMELDQMTPVFGTAQPPKGLSGLMRTLAYKVPEHKARRWLTLLAADRVDMIEHDLGRIMLLLPIAVPVLLMARARRRRSFWQRVFG